MKLIIAYFLFFIMGNNSKIADKNALVGLWLSEEKDLKIEVINLNDVFFAKIVWFKCTPNGPKMDTYKDKNNPDITKRDRLWLGMNVLENLNFNEKGYWQNGKIYEPNSGRKYSATVRLNNSNSLTVRGFWGFELFGKTLNFTRSN